MKDQNQKLEEAKEAVLFEASNVADGGLQFLEAATMYYLGHCDYLADKKQRTDVFEDYMAIKELLIRCKYYDEQKQQHRERGLPAA